MDPLKQRTAIGTLTQYKTAVRIITETKQKLQAGVKDRNLH